jgi:hypothetical protein
MARAARSNIVAWLAVAVAGGIAALAGGCAWGHAQGATAQSEAACRAPKGGTITTANTVCVMVNEDPVDPSVAPVEWKGQTYGLCCNGCRGKWAALSPAEKDAAVARAIAASKH